MVSLQTIYTWFKTKAKPTEAQFRATWDSFWHKSEAIPVDRIEGIDALISDKADNDLLQAHITDDRVHVTQTLRDEIARKANDDELHSVAKSGDFLELNNKNIVPFGEFQIFKSQSNDATQSLQVGDLAKGFLTPGQWIFGKYLGGNVSELDSWEIFTEIGPQLFEYLGIEELSVGEGIPVFTIEDTDIDASSDDIAVGDIDASSDDIAVGDVATEDTTPVRIVSAQKLIPYGTLKNDLVIYDTDNNPLGTVNEFGEYNQNSNGWIGYVYGQGSYLVLGFDS